MRNRPIPHISEADKAYIRDLLIYEDDDVLAFNKPSGLPSQVRGNRARNLDHLLWAFAKSNGKRPRLVHRLDAGTSGVILAAKTQPAAAKLSEAFATRSAKKTYLAIACGRLPDKSSGVFDAPIARIETDRGSQIIAGQAEGKPAQTRWRILARAETHALFVLEPKSGRMHQIRVHLAHAGCPILGDHIYGDRGSAPRLMLHAASIELPHPNGEGMLRISAPAPEDFGACLEKHNLHTALISIG